MIGLKRHTVLVAHYDPAWASLYRQESEAIRRAVGNLVVDVQHVGSTAVPDLCAKPIVDIAVAVKKLDVMCALVDRLISIGYIDRGDGGRDGGYLLVMDVTHHEIDPLVIGKTDPPDEDELRKARSNESYLFCRHKCLYSNGFFNA